MCSVCNISVAMLYIQYIRLYISSDAIVRGDNISSLGKLVCVLAILHSDLDLSLLEFSTINPKASLDHVTSHNGTNALGCTCEHDIALLQSHNLRNVRQLPANAEQHQLRVILLLHLAIDLQIQFHIMRVGNLARRNGSRNRQESVEALCDAPRQALLLGLLLDVAAGHVDGEQVALDAGQPALGVVLVDVAERLADHDAELDFVVEVDAAGAEDGALVGKEDGGGGLEEEEGLLGALVVELLDVVGVVAANAHNLEVGYVSCSLYNLIVRYSWSHTFRQFCLTSASVVMAGDVELNCLQ